LNLIASPPKEIKKEQISESRKIQEELDKYTKLSGNSHTKFSKINENHESPNLKKELKQSKVKFLL